jgi:hypothetical protein
LSLIFAFPEIMRSTKDNPNALQACTAPGLLKTFQTNNTTLEKIHKSLEEYPPKFEDISHSFFDP